MQIPVVQRKIFSLRPWQADDEGSLVRHANNSKIAGNLRDGFPHPYMPSDAKSWLKSVIENKRDIILAIELEGEAAGGIGIFKQSDVYRFNGEIGYWLSQKHWGKGIMSEVVGVLVEYAFTQTNLLRLFAGVFEFNPASGRVLEKNGFRMESIHKKAVMKEGKLMDEHFYALLKEDWETLREGFSGG